MLRVNYGGVSGGKLFYLFIYLLLLIYLFILGSLPFVHHRDLVWQTRII